MSSRTTAKAGVRDLTAVSRFDAAELLGVDAGVAILAAESGNGPSEGFPPPQDDII